MASSNTSVELDALSTQAAQPTLKQSSQRWWLLLLLFTGMLISYAHRGALSVAVATSTMSEDLGLTEASIGILLSAFFWIYSFMQMPAGWLVDRFGVRRGYSLGFLFWSLTSALTGFAGSFAALLGLRVALGIGQAIGFPATSRAVANGFQDRERGMVTSIYLTGVRLGTALISWFGAYFLSRYDWKLFFLVTGLVPLVWVLPWSKFFGKWKESTSINTETGQLTTGKVTFWQSLRLLKQRTVLGIFVGFFAYDYAWFVFLTWLPRYLRKERGFTEVEIGFYGAVPFVVMSIIIVLSGVLSDWLVRSGYEEIKVRKLFILTGLAIGCLIVPAGMVEGKMMAVWLLTMSLCGLGMCSPNAWTLTQAVCEKRLVGTVSGIQNFGGNLGGIMAPAVTGFIAHETGSFALALGLVGVLLVVGIVAYKFFIADTVSIANIALAQPA